jgi:predicted RNA-binding Zn ribbon-like protein
MDWPATLRYGIDPAPGGLALVQDLLNTAQSGPVELDLLDRRETALTWWEQARTSWEAAANRIPVELVLGKTDLDGLREFRSALRLVVTRNNSGADDISDRGVWSLPQVTVQLRLGDDGQVRVEPRDKGWRSIASVALIEVMEAQRVGTWRRLKTCRETLCRAAFYDHSKNNSKVWHDVHTCGNAVNLRAYRARQRVARSHPSELS